MDSCPTLIYTLTYQAISLACNGCQFFATAGPTAWNSLPNPVCNTNEFSGAYKRSKCFCLYCTITLSALMESVYSLMRYTQTDQSLLLPPQGSGTLYPTTSHLHHLFLFSAINGIHFYFRSLIRIHYMYFVVYFVSSFSILRHGGVKVYLGQL